MSDVFHALADPTRRDLLDRLFLKGGLTLSELAEGAPMSRQGVAKHIAILEGANLVTTEWEGRNKRHFLNPVPLTGIVHRWVGKFEDARLDALAEFKSRLETPPEKKETKRHG